MVNRTSSSQDRLTVTLAPGQRESLEAIATHNGTKLAFVIRYALKRFIDQPDSYQIRLDMPDLR